MNAKYVLLKYSSGHNDDTGISIYRDAGEVCDAFDDAAEARSAWVRYERQTIAKDMNFTDFDYEDIAEDFVEWLAKEHGKRFADYNKFMIWMEKNDYISWFDGLSDEQLLTLLLRLDANRYSLEKWTNAQFNQPFYTIAQRIYDSSGETEYWWTYRAGEQFADDVPIFKAEDESVFFEAGKFNKELASNIYIDHFLYGFYSEADRNNAALQKLLARHTEVFKIDDDEIHFGPTDYGHEYTQAEINALHQANRMLEKPMFKIQEMNYIDLCPKI